MKMETLLLITLKTLEYTAATMAQNISNYFPANGLVGGGRFFGNANDERGNNNFEVLNGTT